MGSKNFVEVNFFMCSLCINLSQISSNLNPSGCQARKFFLNSGRLTEISTENLLKIIEISVDRSSVYFWLF